MPGARPATKEEFFEYQFKLNGFPGASHDLGVVYWKYFSKVKERKDGNPTEEEKTLALEFLQMVLEEYIYPQERTLISIEEKKPEVEQHKELSHIEAASIMQYGMAIRVPGVEGVFRIIETHPDQVTEYRDGRKRIDGGRVVFESADGVTNKEEIELEAFNMFLKGPRYLANV